MDGLNVLVRVASERLVKGSPGGLLGNADRAANGGERMMAQPKGDNLLFALSDIPWGVRLSPPARRFEGSFDS